jgi:hypothetical protein
MMYASYPCLLIQIISEVECVALAGQTPGGFRVVLDFFFVSFFRIKGKRKKTTDLKEASCETTGKSTKVFIVNFKRFVVCNCYSLDTKSNKKSQERNPACRHGRDIQPVYLVNEIFICLDECFAFLSFVLI